MVPIGEQQLSLVVLDYLLDFVVDLVDIVVQFSMSLDYLGFVCLGPFLGEKQSSSFPLAGWRTAEEGFMYAALSETGM